MKMSYWIMVGPISGTDVFIRRGELRQNEAERKWRQTLELSCHKPQKLGLLKTTICKRDRDNISLDTLEGAWPADNLILDY